MCVGIAHTSLRDAALQQSSVTTRTASLTLSSFTVKPVEGLSDHRRHRIYIKLNNISLIITEKIYDS